MKWIGQHIWDFISRFRDDVYLEGTDSGTIASGGNLGLDSNNKVVKSASPSGTIDLTSEVTGTLPVGNGGTGASSLTDNAILTGTGASPITAESTLTYDGTTYTSGAVNNIFEHATTGQLLVRNIGNNATAGTLRLENTRGGGDGQPSDTTGIIYFYGNNDRTSGGPESVKFGEIICESADIVDGEEAGEMSFKIPTHPSLTTGLFLSGGSNVDGEIDVTVGAGAASVTTIAGTLTMGSTAAMTNAGLLSVANQSNITGLGTITSGTWTGTAVADTYVANDLTISGGTVNNSIIGGSTPAAITGTTIDANTDFTVGSTVITDDSIVMTPSTSDTVTIAAAANGALNITTVDNAAAAANIAITADGTTELAGTTVTLDSAGAITFEAHGSSTIEVGKTSGTIEVVDLVKYLLPSDFIVSDAAFIRGYQYAADDAGSDYGGTWQDRALDSWAWYQIPKGFKVTHMHAYGNTTSLTNASIYQLDPTDGTRGITLAGGVWNSNYALSTAITSADDAIAVVVLNPNADTDIIYLSLIHI